MRNKKLIFAALFLLCTLLSTVAYAQMSSSIKFNSSVSANGNFDVQWVGTATKVSSGSSNHLAITSQSISTDGDTISIAVGKVLSNDDTFVFDIPVKNFGSVEAKFAGSGDDAPVTSCENGVSITGITPASSTIAPGETSSVRVAIAFSDYENVAGLAKSFDITINFNQAGTVFSLTPAKGYVSSN